MSIDPNAIFDVCILEFDFVPDSGYIKFNYSFGSEEYPEFVGSLFNDAFGFFLTGLNPSGPNYNGANIALIPSSTTPIAINNVNNGTMCPTSGPCLNCQYYVDNCSGTTIQYDGFTSLLSANASVYKDSTYHIKLAIADAGDQIFDSGVFFECGSFSTETKLSTNCMYNGVNNFQNDIDISLSPNPVTTSLQVAVSTPIAIWGQKEKMEAEIFDALGNKIFTLSINHQPLTIDVSAFPKGVYFLHLKSGQSKAVKKFVKI